MRDALLCLFLVPSVFFGNSEELFDHLSTNYDYCLNIFLILHNLILLALPYIISLVKGLLNKNDSFDRGFSQADEEESFGNRC